MLFRSRVLGLAAVVLTAAGAAEAFETKARSALVVDHATGLVLYEKDAEVPHPRPRCPS